MAIVHDDYDMVELLLQHGASVNARVANNESVNLVADEFRLLKAAGDFFLPKTHKNSDQKLIDYEGIFYIGLFSKIR